MIHDSLTIFTTLCVTCFIFVLCFYFSFGCSIFILLLSFHVSYSSSTDKSFAVLQCTPVTALRPTQRKWVRYRHIQPRWYSLAGVQSLCCGLFSVAFVFVSWREPFFYLHDSSLVCFRLTIVLDAPGPFLSAKFQCSHRSRLCSCVDLQRGTVPQHSLRLSSTFVCTVQIFLFLWTSVRLTSKRLVRHWAFPAVSGVAVVLGWRHGELNR